MTYEVEAVIEVQMPSLQLEHFDEGKNDEGLRLSINTTAKFNDTTLSQIISQKQAIIEKYN